MKTTFASSFSSGFNQIWLCLLCLAMASPCLSQESAGAKLRGAFQTRLTAQTALTDAEILKLREKACQAVDAFVAKSQKAGKLEEVVAGKALSTALASPVTLPDEPENKELQKIWSSFMSQRKALMKKETEALAIASRPYLAELERMKQQYTRDGDLEKALAVKAEANMVLLGRGGPEMKSKMELAETLTGLSCEWLVKKEDGYKVYSQFRFGVNQKIEGGGLLPWLAKWETLSATQVKIIHQDGGFWVFELELGTGTGQPTSNVKGARNDGKRIQLKREKGPSQ